MKCLAWGTVVCICALPLTLACGGTIDSGTGDGGSDAGADAKPIKKDAAPTVDAAYQPIGTKCDPPTGTAPAAWTPADAGAPLRPPLSVSSGGPTLTDPQFVTMTFDGDDLRDPIEDFMNSVGCSSYWHAVAPDYGINDGYALPPVHLTETPPTTIDDAQIGTFIRQKVLSKQIPDDVTGKTLYVIYYPDTTDITLQGQHSCQSFGGYHNEIGMADGRTIPYAVIPRCSGGGLGVFDEVTGTTSHELFEAVTDPLPMSNPAYQFPEGNGVAWAITGGGEIGDLCESYNDAFFQPSDYPFTVQHIWTNHSAYDAHDPCQPSQLTYIAAAPVLPDVIPFNIGLGSQTTTGVKLALNASTTIDLDLMADAAWTTPISVVVHDASHYFGGNTALSFSLSASQGNVGDVLKLTITRIGTNQQIGLEPFVIRASSQGIQRSWWAVVGDP
jgi:hypothetical protein